MSRIACSVVAASAILLATGCNGRLASKSEPREPAAEVSTEYQVAPDDPGVAPSSESERTRAMQEKQAEMERKMAEARAGNLSPEELQRVYQEVEQDRQELNRMGEGEPPPADASAVSDYPPPPR